MFKFYCLHALLMIHSIHLVIKINEQYISQSLLLIQTYDYNYYAAYSSGSQFC
jgi:hypothetical protein